MTIERAFEKAIAAGYPLNYFDLQEMVTHWEVPCYDPSFWQSLGKAMGWNTMMCPFCYRFVHSPLTPDEQNELQLNGLCLHSQLVDYTKKWRNVWHCFIDHLAEGKTAEEFFEGMN